MNVFYQVKNHFGHAPMDLTPIKYGRSFINPWLGTFTGLLL